MSLSKALTAAAGNVVTSEPFEGYFNIGAASYNGFFSVSSEIASCAGGCWGDSGTKFYANNYTLEGVFQYTASTAYDITSLSYASLSKTVSDGSSARCMQFKPDGTALFIPFQSSGGIRRYNLSTAWNISSMSATAANSVAGQGGSDCGIFLSSDGTKLFSVNFAASLRKWTLSTPWDLSTASVSQTVDLSGTDSSGRDILFSPDGTEMLYFGSAADSVYRFTLSSAWDLTTLNYESTFDPGSVVVPIFMVDNGSGSKLYLGDNSNGNIRQYNL